ncbi:MAG: RsmD family RNA methyltransferase [Phycisphaerales bacterium]|nr:MAG: RsmD family RNA methyltransferase [Phycisphaerales bacterium]
MRIVGGQWRGRTLRAPRTERTRPVLDRVKTSIFDRLGAHLAMPGSLPPISVLDMFAGSGAFGLEALSRGAAYCCFIDSAWAALTALRANIDSLGCAARAVVLATDTMRWEVCCPWEGGYGLVFVDPPYRYLRDEAKRAGLGRLLRRLAVSEQVQDDAVILFRCEADVDLPDETGPMKIMDDQKYGRMRIWWLQVSRGCSLGSSANGPTDPA